MARGKDTSKHPARRVDRLTFIMPTHGVVLNQQQTDSEKQNSDSVAEEKESQDYDV